VNRYYWEFGTLEQSLEGHCEECDQTVELTRAVARVCVYDRTASQDPIAVCSDTHSAQTVVTGLLLLQAQRETPPPAAALSPG
jgi:hypothetical protein